MADGSAIVLAPAGWGHIPGALIGGDVRDALPDLPLLPCLGVTQRGRAIVEAVQSVPGLAERLLPQHLQAKYGVPQATASDLLARARGDAQTGADAATIASRILRVLADGPSTTGEVAAELGLKSKLAATHLYQLVQRGKVTREPFEDGRSAFLWSLAHG